MANIKKKTLAAEAMRVRRNGEVSGDVAREPVVERIPLAHDAARDDEGAAVRKIEIVSMDTSLRQTRVLQARCQEKKNPAEDGRASVTDRSWTRSYCTKKGERRLPAETTPTRASMSSGLDVEAGGRCGRTCSDSASSGVTDVVREVANGAEPSEGMVLPRSKRGLESASERTHQQALFEAHSIQNRRTFRHGGIF